LKPIDRYIREKQNETRLTLNTAFNLGWDASQERIIDILNDPVYNELSRAHLIGIIQGASLDGEWD